MTETPMAEDVTGIGARCIPLGEVSSSCHGYLVVDAALDRLYQGGLHDEGDIAGGAAVPVVEPQTAPVGNTTGGVKREGRGPPVGLQRHTSCSLCPVTTVTQYTPVTARSHITRALPPPSNGPAVFQS